jgi:toxin CcdB
MAQFDVYENINTSSKKDMPFLLDVQNDILDELNSRIVVPLSINSKHAKILNPIFTINSQNLIMSTAQLSSIPIKNIGIKVCSLKHKRDEIISAIDFLITGY